jgi:ectoine hydroxylase-related dioxygenase (phytanoyl-CoA dioxygenase family)
MKLIKQSEDACVHDTISEKHMEFYEENGYLIIKNSISKEKLENFISSALKVFMLQAKKSGYKNDPIKTNSSKDKLAAMDEVVGYLIDNDRHSFDEGNKILASNLSSILIQFNEKINDIYSKLLDVDKEILSLYGPSLLVKKPLNSEGIYTWHTEAHWFPKRRNFLNIWFPFIRKHDSNSGTMFILPGSHKKPDWQFSEYKQSNAGRFDFAQYDIPSSELKNYEEMPVNISIGDMIITNRNTVHRGSTNSSGNLSYVAVARIFDYSRDLTISSNPSERPYKADSEKNGRMSMITN